MENETEVSETIIDEVPSIGAPSLKAGIEAILLVVDEPVNAITLAQITNSPEIEGMVLTSIALAANRANSFGPRPKRTSGKRFAN